MSAPTRFTRREALKTLFCSSVALALNLRPLDLLGAEFDGGDLHLLAIGDFGTGKEDQIAVAKAMQKYVADHKVKTEGVLLLGDNFYGKMEGGLKSERWNTGIESMYPASSFPGPLWTVLGNHDYHDNLGGEKTQLAYAKQGGTRWTMPAKWYRTDFPKKDPMATFIFLDSNLPAVSGEAEADGKKKAAEGAAKKKMPCLTEEESAEQAAWLKAELAKPRGKFTVVVGHHPIYSNGQHGDTKKLVEAWDKPLEAAGVNVYLCGHDHDMQHLELEGRKLSYVLSGGGGQKTRELHGKHTAPYGKDVHGFTHIQIGKDQLVFRHVDVTGVQVHSFAKAADGGVKLNV
jgi:3',5'-cyclic AMP phosphodiesterase CpdA